MIAMPAELVVKAGDRERKKTKQMFKVLYMITYYVSYVVGDGTPKALNTSKHAGDW